jgi:hypothetical protein
LGKPVAEVAGAKSAGNFDLIAVAGLLIPAFAATLANRAGVIGLHNDDAFYAVAAKLIAEGGDPFRSDLTYFPPLERFPIGFPILLALMWRVAGGDIGIVPLWEIAVATATFAFLVASYGFLTRRWAVSPWMAGCAVMLVALHPLTLKYGASAMSDLPTAVAVMGCLALAERARSAAAPPAGSGVPPGSSSVPSGSSGIPPTTWALLAGAGFGLTLVMRYAAAAPLAAVFLVLAFERRLRAAFVLAASAAVVASPWTWVVMTRRLYGYSDQFVAHSAGRPLAETIGSSALGLLSQALPGLIAPAAFLDGLMRLDLPIAPQWSWKALVGSVVAVWLIVACILQLRRPERRLPAAYGLATVALVLFWAGAFRYLAWDLQVRLLLPVAPILLAFALETALAPIRRLPAWRQAAVGAILATFALWWFSTSLRIDFAQIRENDRGAQKHLQGMLSARAYVQRIPKDVKVGASNPFEAYFYLDRPFHPVLADASSILAARDRGVRVLLATPDRQGGRDKMMEAVKALLGSDPPRARILYAPTDDIAVVHLPAEQLPAKISR